MDKSDWISVNEKEKLPEIFQSVLFTDGYEVFKGYIADPLDDITQWYNNGDDHIYGVTHWMPLPEPPEKLNTIPQS